MAKRIFHGTNYIDLIITVSGHSGSAEFEVDGRATEHYITQLAGADDIYDYDIEVKTNDSDGYAIGRFGREGLSGPYNVYQQVTYKGKHICYLSNVTEDADYLVRIYFG